MGGVSITPDDIMQKTFVYAYTESWLRAWSLFSSVSEIHRSICMCNSTNDRNQSLFSVHYEIQLICFSILVRSIEKAQEFCIETTELWVETVWNRNMQFIDIYHFPTSSKVSERANAWAKWNARAKLASEWVSGASNWAERRSKWPGA